MTGGTGGSASFELNNVNASMVGNNTFHIIGGDGGMGSLANLGADGVSGGDANFTVNDLILNSEGTNNSFKISGGLGADGSLIEALTLTTPGDGGNGGNATATINTVTISGIYDPSNTFIISGGDGGTAATLSLLGGGSSGGDGGDATVNISNELNIQDGNALVVSGGIGANGGGISATVVGGLEPGGGGEGGDGILNISNGTINLSDASSLSLASHNGADGGDVSLSVLGGGEQGGAGGDSGDAIVNAETINITGDNNKLSLNSGDGGTGGTLTLTLGGDASAGSGGNAGDTSLIVTNIQVTGNNNTFEVTSGTNGTGGAVNGSGGNATLQVTEDFLVTGTGNNFDVTKGDGIVTVYAENLQVGTNTTTGQFTYNQTNDLTSADSVIFDTLTLVDGGEFKVGTGVAFGGTDQARFNNLTVTHSGVLELGVGNTYNVGATDVITFNLSSGLDAGNSVLTVTNGNINIDNLHLDNLHIKLSGSLSQLLEGESFYLVNNNVIVNSGAFLNEVIKSNVLGGLTLYDFKLNVTGNSIIATLMDDGNNGGGDGGGNNGQYKPYSEAIAASLLSVIEGSRALEDSISIISNGKPGEASTSIVVKGTSMQNDTGSHVKVDQLTTTLAAGYKFAINKQYNMTLGAFLEIGSGDYNTYNNLATLGNIDGKGDLNYYGGGIFMANNIGKNIHAEASVRGGAIKNGYDIATLNSGASFDSTATYWGAHLGGGYDFYLSNKDTIDVYGKVFWTRVNSDGFTTAAGEEVVTDDTDSVRSRLGATYGRTFYNSKLKAFIGAGWEHEYMGEAAITVNSIKQDQNADLKGSSAFGELGISSQTTKYINLNAGLYGLLGQQQGYGGSLSIKVIF